MSALTDRLGEIEARAQAATRPPWVSFGTWPFDVIGDASDTDGGTQVLVIGSAGREQDSVFAAAARTDVPWLVEQVRVRDEALRSVLAVHHPCDNDASRTPICQVCHGKSGVWECGCWADEDRSPVCSTCVDIDPVRNGHGAAPYPCPTVRTITATLAGEA